MKITEIFEHVLNQSGQFIIDTDCIELNVDRFVTLVKLALATYSKYNPHVEHLWINANGGRQYTFTIQDSPLGPPDYLSDAIPARISGVPPLHLRNMNSNVECKTQFPWVYRKPILTTPVNAKYDVTAVWKHRLVGTTSEGGKKIWCVDTIDIECHESFFDLLTGRFLKGLGRSRRAFTMSDLPIVADASDLVSDGEQMEKDALDEIRDTEHDFYLAWK